MKKRLLLVSVLLSGCTSIETLRPDIAARPVPSRLDEIAYINTLREAYDGPEDSFCYDGTGLKRFNPTLVQGYNDHVDAEESAPSVRCVKFKDLDTTDQQQPITRYLEAGFGLTDLYCQRFFTIAAESALKRRFERNAGTALDGLVGSILGFAGAGAAATGIVNSGFAAVDSTFQNIDDSFMVAPDLENVRELVKSAQAEYRAQVFKPQQTPRSYPAARSVIESYAGICSFNGMKQLVNASLAAEKKQLDRKTEEVQRGGSNDVVTEGRPVAPPPPGTERPDAAATVPPSGSPDGSGTER